MLSPGVYYKSVPKNYYENLIFREKVLLRAKPDLVFRMALIEACRVDFLFWINVFAFQFNPKKKGGGQAGPFITWPYQDRFLIDRPETTGRPGLVWCYEKDKSAVVEKSREMGASWQLLLFQVWLCIFHGYTQCLNISCSAKAVDDASPDSLFWKIRFIHQHLPDWLKGEIVDNKFHFGYTKTKSFNTGVASTGRAGVGGRASLVNIDEFPLIEEDVEVRQRTAGTTDCRIFTGTHQGTGTQFFELTESPEFVKFQMHWTRHPDKNKGLYSYDTAKKKLLFWEYIDWTDEIVQITGPKIEYEKGFDFIMDGKPSGGPHPGVRSPWYDWKSKDIGSERGVAMELDMNAKGSVSQFFDPLLIRELKQYCRAPVFEGDIGYDDYGNPGELHEREGGTLRLWCTLEGGRPPKASYGAGCDVSGGSGATPSCLSITNGQTGEKVAEYFNSRIDPKEFGTLAVALCKFFHGAKIVWEHIGPGVNFGTQVMDLGYVNIYTKVGEDKLGRPRTDSVGWNPMGMTKLMIEYASALRKREMWNRSWRALEECLAFKYDARGKVVHAGKSGDDLAAARENHGDLTVSDALSWKMVREEGRLTLAIAKREATIAKPYTLAWYMEEEAAQELAAGSLYSNWRG